jgi:hypothetical protein
MSVKLVLPFFPHLRLRAAREPVPLLPRESWVHLSTGTAT